MSVPGICIGLLCGLAHAVTYLFSRRFMKTEGHTAGQLAVLAHIAMGVMSVCLLPFLWRTPENGWLVTAWPLFGCTVFYMAGQICMFRAVEIIEASRVAPMLGIKIAVLAMMITVTGTGHVSPRQWVAVAIGIVAVRLINFSPGSAQTKVPLSAYLWVVCTCIGYALSDFHIGLLLKALSSNQSPAMSAFAVVLTYTLAGSGALLFFIKYRKSTAKAWRMAIPFSIGWYASMMTLFITMGYIGVVGAAILQSTRGIWAICLGVGIAHLGHVHLESKVPLKQRLIQFAAGLLMCVAIGLYATGAS